MCTWGREGVAFWDGLLRVDWLERELLKREAEFSTYRKIKVQICSWNIDSCKPADLHGDTVNIEFLNNAISSSIDPAITSPDPPEIIVFGFQEVVDLENKKVTASEWSDHSENQGYATRLLTRMVPESMLLGKKKADQLFQDQVSHQYMRWHDRIVQAVRTAMPATAPYTVLHAESMVGVGAGRQPSPNNPRHKLMLVRPKPQLFTCIFIRDSEKPNLSDLAGQTVKTGMRGRYGNKVRGFCNVGQKQKER